MDDSRLNNLNELKEFLTSAKRLVLVSQTINAKYRFINRTLKRFNYCRLKRKDKHAVLLYIKKVTGYKKAQTLRLVKRSLAGELTRTVYHINAVDEVTQWEVVVCVPQISERYLLPALRRLIHQFPFRVFNFHSDRGSEFINKVVAKLLNKLLIEQTKSRSRHSNDNALVESKNGWVIRKNMGYTHINFTAAEAISEFYQNWFNPYLNFHRPCLFVTQIRRDGQGRETKIYGQATTPYEKLKETGRLLNQNFLKSGITLAALDKVAYADSDNRFAAKMRLQEKLLFSKISQLKG